MVVNILKKYKMWWYFKKCCHIQNTGLKTSFRHSKKSLKETKGVHAANVTPFKNYISERQIYA
jgi:hypothetical protein